MTFLAALGFSVQETLIGYVRFATETKPVVACKNFVPLDSILLSFKTIANSLLPEKLGKVPRLSDLYAIFDKPSSYFDAEDCEIALHAYWDLFILDAFLGNFDRHGDNWGYIQSFSRKSIVPSPIYDCGSCLYPQISDEAMGSILQNEEEKLMRVNKFPNAALIIAPNSKVNYRQYIYSLTNKDCTAALIRIFPRIDLPLILGIVDSASYLTDIRKQFYKTMLQLRYDLILAPAYKRALSEAETTFFIDYHF